MMIARGFCIALIILIYAILVHHVNASGQASSLGAMLALAPVLLLAITLAGNASSRLAGAGLLLVSATLSWLAWPAIKQYTGLV
ncbi:MAG: hypothetical protein ACXW1P_10790, partial [Methylophilaceae bacterium]